MRRHRNSRFIELLLISCAPLWALLAMGGCPTTPPDDGGTGQVTDTDNDGVRNNLDDCPNTTAGADVDENGCAQTQRDTDTDGVTDDLDTCPDTLVGADVDANGCPAAPSDEDNDGVADGVDECPGTAENTTVGTDGCPVSDPGAPDADADGVGDDIDVCPDTPADAPVDRGGCAAAQRDTDADGVNDADDRCAGTTAGTDVNARGCPVVAPGTPDADEDGIPDDADTCANTPADSTVDANGCAANQRDTDDDGVNDDLDQCPGTIAGANVNSVGCPMDGGGGTVCGNGNVEAGEECDPPNGSTCDVNCRNTTGGQLANNICGSPTPVGNGLHNFSNVGASTDGRDEPGQCVISTYTQVDADVWYCYTATSTEPVVFSLCGSDFDTKMMVYAGCDCPSTAPIGCSDDDCGKGTDSRAVVNAIDGLQYMIRVGGFRGETGSGGRLTIFPQSDTTRGDNSCTGGTGGCFMLHANPGCDTTAACTGTCDVDQFCCDVEWDSVCATKADGIINGFDACGPASGGSCFDPSPTGGPVRMGCDDTTCCQTVCTGDPFCCLTEWDDICAESVGAECGQFAACQNTTATCFSQHAGPGCSLASCCNMICENDPACCTVQWDDVCVEAANALRLSGQCLP